MIFDNAIHYSELPESDLDLKNYLNYNPVHNAYTKKQNFPGRSPTETDRGGWRGYDRVYTKYFVPLREEKLNILEIGIKEGYGIYAWQKYFKNATLYGLDIDWKPGIITQRNILKNKHKLFQKARLYNLDSTKEDNWIHFYGKEFDIIIDDGDHHPYSQIETFKHGWKYLKAGGLFFIEDVGHRYGEECIKHLSDFIESRKDQIELIDIYYHNNTGLQVWLNLGKKNQKFAIKSGLKNLDATSNEYIIAIRKKQME